MRVREAATVFGLFSAAAVAIAAARVLQLTAEHAEPAPQPGPQQTDAQQTDAQQPDVRQLDAQQQSRAGGSKKNIRKETVLRKVKRLPAAPTSRPATVGPTTTLSPSALDRIAGCCIGPGCDPREHFDSWCYGSGRACPELKPGGWACGEAWGGKCVSRWRGALSSDAQGAMSFRDVARCASALVDLSNTAWRFPPLPEPGEGPDFSAADFPLGVVNVRHNCWRPCNTVWPCRGKLRPDGYLVEFCWRNFYKVGKHHPTRRAKSIMAVWLPPVVDQISGLLTQNGNYDTKLHALIRGPLGRLESGTAVDVGANLGVVTMFAALQGHRVVAFDATPWTRHKLQLSVWLNNFSSMVRVVPAAVGAAVGTASLAVVPGNLGGNQLVRDEQEELVAGNSSDMGRPGVKGTIEVPVTTLDEALRDEKDVFFIKIDIEGHEIQALQGAAQVLRHHKPTLVVETCFWCRPRVLFELMQQHDYVCGREDTVVDRTGRPWRGHWKWDVEQVLRPQYRHQLRPNILCIWDPAESRKPFDPNPGAPYDKQWTAYRVDT